MSSGTDGGPSDFLELTILKHQCRPEYNIQIYKTMVLDSHQLEVCSLTSVHKKSNQMFFEKYKLVSYLEKVKKLSENE